MLRGYSHTFCWFPTLATMPIASPKVCQYRCYPLRTNTMDGSNYQTAASGLLLEQEGPQTFGLGSVTCRTVRLTITNGVDAQAWELAEFALHGTLTNDPDADGLVDAWEDRYFHGFDRDGAGDFETDGLTDSEEYDFGSDPTVADSDNDGCSDRHEWIADTNPTNEQSRLRLSGIHADGGMIRVDWEGGRQALQKLEYHPDIMDTGTVWTAIRTNQPPTDISNSVLLDMATNRCFFRIKAER